MADLTIPTDVPQIPQVDMISATSKLQLEAADVRSNKPNWNSYLRSQMITQEDYDFITSYEMSKTKQSRDELWRVTRCNVLKQ
ncbi:V-ATPase subunit H family protein [Brugia pahangi]